MKRTVLVGLALGMSLSLALGQEVKLESQKDKTSYALGMNMGTNLKRQEVEVNLELLVRGIKDALSGSESLLNDDQMRETFQTLQTEMRRKAEDRRKAEGEKNKKEGEAFLKENAAKDGVVSLPSGLQYKVVKEGSGPIPQQTDRVKVHYRGRLIDGTEFDSSHQRGQPASFPLTGVIRGWTEALQLMKVGSEWELYIPSGLAYGERGSPPKIGADAVLIFNVELLGIEPPAEPREPVTSDIIKVPSAEELKKGAKIEIIKPEEAKKLAAPKE